LAEAWTTVSGVSDGDTNKYDAEAVAYLTVDSSVLCILQARRARAGGRILDGRSYNFVRHGCELGRDEVIVCRRGTWIATQELL
jgi:hypothetical protein